jgi:hypothetical protein
VHVICSHDGENLGGRRGAGDVSGGLCQRLQPLTRCCRCDAEKCKSVLARECCLGRGEAKALREYVETEVRRDWGVVKKDQELPRRPEL